MSQVDPGHVGVEHPHLLAHGLDEYEVDALGGLGVEPVGVSKQAEGFIEGTAHGVDLDGPLGDGGIGGLGLVADARLFELELIQGEGVVIVGVFGFGSFVLQAGQALALAGDLDFAFGVAADEVRLDGGLEGLDAILGELDGVPVVGDSPFNFLDRHVALGAAVFVFLATQTVEVGVALAGALFGRHGDAQTHTAASTVQDPFEVVGPGLGLVFVEVAGGQDGVHGVPGRLIDERLVVSHVLDALPADNTQIEAVVQDAVHLLGPQGAFRQPLGGGQPKSQVVGLVGEVAQGIEAGGVAAEAVGDDGSGDGIDADDADILAGDLHALVDVALGSLAGQAPGLGLLAHALLGLFREVAGVPLGDGGHDPVYQLAGRRLVDVLGSRDELDAVLGEQQAELHVILAAAGEPVELVDDDIADLGVLLDAPKHALEFGPVSRPGALAPVDELLGDGGAEVGGLAAAVVALGLDREAIVVIAGVGLLAG